MFTLLMMGLVAVIGIAVMGLVAAVFTLVTWVLFLPFKVMAFTLKGLAFLLALPFMLLFGILGVAVFGAGVLVFLLPFIPFVLLAWLLVRLTRPRPRTATA